MKLLTRFVFNGCRAESRRNPVSCLPSHGTKVVVIYEFVKCNNVRIVTPTHMAGDGFFGVRDEILQGRAASDHCEGFARELFTISSEAPSAGPGR